MAIIRSCTISGSLKNTGVECNKALGPTSTIVSLAPGTTFTDADLEDFNGWLQDQLHAAPALRAYAFFGSMAPIISITNNNEADVTETFDNGGMAFIRSGMMNKTFLTDGGGLCFAKSLRSFNRSKRPFIEFDGDGNFAVMDLGNGVYSGFPTNQMFSPIPIAADFKTVYKNQLSLNFSPAYYIDKGLILTNQDGPIDVMGLLDTEVVQATTDAGVLVPSSTTKLKIDVRTVCDRTDLVEQIGAGLAVVGNFVITNVATGVIVTPTAAAIVAGHIELTGTYVSASVYRVALAIPSVLLANSIQGYEGVNSVDITIP